MKNPNILWLDEIGMKDLELVGGKNGSLGELIRGMRGKKIGFPEGFALTSYVYRSHVDQGGGFAALKKILKGLDPTDTKQLETVGKKARTLILERELPEEVKEEVLAAYRTLASKVGTKNLPVAVRSSATAEDLPTASFAGQQETYLNISGEKALLEACKNCFASLFTDRAIAYRCENKIDHIKVSLSVGVQGMIRSDIGSAGVLFTLDTETGFQNVVYVTGCYGLGENLVQGAVNPDEFYVFKPTLAKGYRPLIDKKVGDKKTKIIYGKKGDPSPIQRVATTEKERRSFCVSDEDVLTLSKWGVAIEEYYSKRNKRWTPMDIEWAKDGKTGKLFIVQARPETVQSRRSAFILEEFSLKKKGKELAIGKSIGKKIGQGNARVITDVKEGSQFQEGEVLVTDMTDPDWVPLMRKAAAIVTNRGGRTSHAAIVSRELGLPCVVGTGSATEAVSTGVPITIDCSQGEKGIVYDSLLEFSVKKIDVRKIPKVKTEIMINIGYPDEAFALSFLPSDGVGLAREEFIINEYIRIHPMALVHFDKVEDPAVRSEIERLTFGYSDKKEFFVDKLAMGISIIGAAFYPKDVILRFSDFKTNEYVNLIGGQYFEPQEENPMLGWRGASRYYKEGYQEGFALECRAVKKAREEFGLTNIKVMIPMCRTVEEGKKVLQVMKTHGLVRKKKGLEVYCMCEIPSNVVLADQLSEIFDGFSIGSNDLTQLTLGVDRDSALVADIFDERNEAVLRMVKQVIATARKKRKKIGICGDAPSTYPEFAKFLVDCGITSISLSPDSVVQTRLLIAKHEQRKKRRKK